MKEINIEKLEVNKIYKVYKEGSPMELGDLELFKVTETVYLFSNNIFIYKEDILDYKFFAKDI